MPPLKTLRRIRCALLPTIGLLLVAQLNAQEPHADAPAPSAAQVRPLHATQSERRLYEALDRRITFDFRNKPLTEVADYLRTTLQIPVEIDDKALAADGFDDQSEITSAVHDARLVDALETMLQPVHLGYTTRFGTLLLTTLDGMNVQRADVRVYPVHDLVVRKNDPNAAFPELEALTELVEMACAPETWNFASCEIRYYEGPGILVLVVIQSPVVHKEIEEFLAQLRAARSPEVAALEAALPSIESRTEIQAAGTMVHYPGPPPPARLPAGKVIHSTSPREEAIHAALENPAQLERKKVALGELRAAVEKLHKIPVILDAMSLEADGRDEQFAVEVAGGDGPLYDVLQFALDRIGMGIVVRNEQLQITSRFADEDQKPTRVYQVHDLLMYGRTSEGVRPDFESLIELVYSTVQPEYFGEGGYGGTNLQFTTAGTQTLVLGHTEIIHRDIERLFKMLRAAYVPELHEAQRRRRVDLPPGAPPPATNRGGMGGGMF